MKLYFSPGACSLAPHIVLNEAAFPSFDIEKVDLAKKLTATGEGYLQINPKGYVPAIRLDNGEILTEVAVILQYLADSQPESALAPPAGTLERYRLMEWLNFVSSEIHKQLGPLFNATIPDVWRSHQVELLGSRYDFLGKCLNAQPYLMGEHFSVADAYLFTVLRWNSLLHVDTAKWPWIGAYLARVAARPAVIKTLKEENLV
ncbi:MAG: glutathione transferase GstA [Sulfuricella sp.]|nr:glutathione transferase GstA [Sulfuricella sp.]